METGPSTTVRSHAVERCPECHRDSRADANFCSHCGSVLVRVEAARSNSHGADGVAAHGAHEDGPRLVVPATRGSKPTIRDVARHAGVSRSTVSRVLNGVQVQPGALVKVNQAIEQLGFRVNQVARDLARGRTGSVAYVVSDHREHLLEDPSFGVVTASLSRELTARRTRLLITTAHDEEEEDFLADYLLAGHVDGVVLALSEGRGDLLRRLLASGLPTVVIGRPAELEDVTSWVGADDKAAAFDMVKYLAARSRLGAVATIAGPPDSTAARERLAGYRRAVGRRATSRLIAYGDWSYDSGREAATELLEGGSRFDALFAANDIMAAGAMSVLRRMGLSVPGDIAVAGFDDSSAAKLTDPPLTTVHNPFTEFGVEAVRIVSELMAGRLSEPHHMLIPTHLVVRGSA